MTRSAAWDGMIVLCAANRWDGVKMQDRHLAETSGRTHLCSTWTPLSRT